MIHKLILSLVLFLSIISCKENKKENNSLNKNKMKNEIINTINSYKQYPNYSIQVDKGGCSFELLGNTLPFYSVFIQGGFSALIPFNANILKSGLQTITVKVYPDNGKTTFDDYTIFSIKIMFFKNDKDSTGIAETIQKFEIPKEVIQKKLPYYETKLTFDANVPFDNSSKLLNAQDLSKIPNLEKKVLNQYNKIIEWLNQKDLKSISNFRRKTDEKLCNVFYYESEKSINDMFDYSSLFQDNKKPDHLPPYKMVFYSENKLVRLVRLDNKDEVITLTGKTNDGDEITSDLSILLYIPIGETEFKNY